MPIPSAPLVTGVGGITFGVAKDTLRLVCDNGVGPASPRVLRRANEATQELLSATDPRTDSTLIPVGCMASYIITSLADGYLLLPKELENVYLWGVLPPNSAYGRRDTSQGYYDLINPATYVDPTVQHDNPLADDGLVPDPDNPTILRRRMHYQTLPEGSLVILIGKRRYLPMTGDADYLIIQNIPALKTMIQAIEYRENGNQLWESLKNAAIKILSDEAKNFYMDPNWSMQRKADYETDLVTYAPNTLGYIRARLVLEVPTLSRVGRVEGARLINQAMREAIDHHNFLGRTERYSFVSGSNQLEFTLAVEPQDILVYGKFEVLRLLILAQRTPPEGVQPPQTSMPARDQAYALIERNLDAEAQQQRLDFYRTDTEAAAIPGCFRQVVDRLGLELPGFLELSLNQVSDLVLEAVREAVDHRNFLGRTERYSLEEGPNQITYTLPIGDLDILPFTNFDVIRLLVMAQRTPPTGVQPNADANPMRQQAYALIERNLAAEVESLRTATHVAAFNSYPMWSRGWMVARIGLELPGALEYTVKRLGDAVDRAEMRLIENGTWKGTIQEFNAKIANGRIYLPITVGSMLAINLCGHCEPVRSVFYKYLKNGPGECACGGLRVEDEGEKYFKDGNAWRRVYRVTIPGVQVPAIPPPTEQTPGTITPPVGSGIVYLSQKARLVGIPTGTSLEILDSTSGEWVLQASWSEGDF